MQQSVVISPYQPQWPQSYEAIAAKIRPLLGPNLVALHHIGSTSVTGLDAKPIIDLLAAVHDLTVLDPPNPNPLAPLGFDSLGEFGISGRRYFRRDDHHGLRTHHLHVFTHGDPHLTRHLAFRDYLRAHPAAAAEYAALKHRLVHAHPNDREAYMDGKDPFIKQTEAAALQWYATQPATS